MNDLTTGRAFSLAPTSLGEAMKLAEVMAGSDMVPRDYKGKAGNVLIAVQMGAELGLQPMQAIQNIAVINGRPALWGDAALAVVSAHPECEDVVEKIDGEGEAMTASCTIKRKGREPVVRKFGYTEAKRAGLWGKEGPWKTYPQRMLQMRARSWAMRDAFADALRGIGVVEEVRDIPQPKDIEAEILVSAEQVARLTTELTEVGGDQEAFKGLFKITALEQMRAVDFDRALLMIHEKRKRKKAEETKIEPTKVEA